MSRFAQVAQAVALAASIPVTCGCGEHANAGAAPQASRDEDEALPVSVALAERRDVPILIRAVGAVDSAASVVLKPQRDGRVVEVGFAEGEDVKAGDVLLVLDQRPARAALQLAEATLARDTAMAKDAELAAEQVASVLEAEAVSRREAQQARASADAAQASVSADAAAVELARLNLEYCTIRAPFDGRAGLLGVRVGSVVQAGDTELLTIHQIAPIRVGFAVPQDRLPELRRQQAQAPLEVEVTLPEAPDGGAPPAVVRGRVTFIDNAVDTATGTIRLMATFENADRRLWPGQYVDVALEVGVDRGAIAVPMRAVQTGQKGPYAFVVREDRSVELRLLDVLRAAGDVTLIRGGLESGERVVTDGQLRLVDGALVQLQE